MSSDNGFLRTARVVLIAVISWFVLNIISELIGNQANETALGQVIGRIVLMAAVVVLPAAMLIWFVLYLRHRPVRPAEAEPVPVPAEPPAWHRPDPLHGRESEVDEALERVHANGIVAVVGPRDVGTSAVAEAIVQRLVDELGPGRATRFDLRSRSSKRPDDARAAAGRIVSAFGLDEPADDTAELLADAGRRLVAALRDRYDVLLLDNASIPEEVEWLAGQWPAGGRPWLVIAGESAIAPVVERSAVDVGELDLPTLRAMWEAEVGPMSTTRLHRLRDRFRGRGRPSELDALLRACFGRPRALKAFAREILRPDSTVTIESLLAAVNSPGPVDGPLERVWTAILDHVRDGLSADAVWLLHALAELPVTALSRTAIAAMLSGRGAGDPLEELRIRNLVQETDGRYRLPIEVRRAIAGTTAEQDRREYALEAVPALLRHYAQDAARWAARLGSGPTAVEWFHDAERSLRPLLSKEGYLDEALLELVIDDLAGIADALEAWYVREQQSGGLYTTADALYVLAERANRPELAGVAAVRMATARRIAGSVREAGPKLEVAAAYADRLRDEAAAELKVRVQVERALLGMTAAAGLDRDELAKAEKELDQILADHPGHPGMTVALINLGALCLHQGRPAEALGHLRRAERLATDRRDTGCLAHAVELQGVALSGDDLPEAVRLWWCAREWFHLTGEEQGEARCLQHLGAAALIDRTVAGQIRDGRPGELTEREAAAVALPLLEQAKALRAGQPDTRLVEHYLGMARQWLESNVTFPR